MQLFNSTSGNPIRRFLDTLAARWQHEKKIQTGIRELAQLDDRSLADLGIHRCDIEAVIRRHSPFDQPRPQMTLVPAKAPAARRQETEEDLPKAA